MKTAAGSPDDARQDTTPQLDPFWQERIDHDRLWHGHRARVGEWLLDAHDGHLFQVRTNRVDEDGTLQLEAADRLSIGAVPNYEPVTESHLHTTITAFGGAVEAGELLHLPRGGVVALPDATVVINLGDVVLHLEDDDVGASLLDHAREVTPSEPPGLPAPPGVFLGPEYSPQQEIAAADAFETETLQQHSAARHFDSEDRSVLTRFIPVPRYSKWTFELTPIREWVEHHLPPGGRVLNACAGQQRLAHDGEVVRNDIDERRPADRHVDVAELAAHFPESSFDAVVFDPSWNLYQANLRYDGHHVRKTWQDLEIDIDLQALPFEIPGPEEKDQLGHARLAKEGFDYLLKPGGKVIELTFHGTCMPGRMDYERVERVIFDPIGEGKAVIGSVDRQTQAALESFLA